MKRTLLRGEACIYGRRVVDTTAKKWKEEGRWKRTSLKIGHWESVMQAGLALHPIGEYVKSSEDNMGPRVKLSLPDVSDKERCLEDRGLI